MKLKTRTAMSMLAVSAILLAGTACTNDNQVGMRPTPNLTFANYGSISLPVSSANVIKPTPTNDGVNRTGYGVLPVPVDEVLSRYVDQRFTGTGAGPIFTFVIEETSFNQSELSGGQGFSLDVLTMRRREKFDIGAVVRVEIDYGNLRKVTQKHRLNRSLEIGEGVSLAERDLKLVQFLERFVSELDGLVVPELKKEFQGLSATPILPPRVVTPLKQMPVVESGAQGFQSSSPAM